MVDQFIIRTKYYNVVIDVDTNARDWWIMGAASSRVHNTLKLFDLQCEIGCK